MVSFAAFQVLNLLQTTFLFGLNLCLSFVCIPAIYLSDSPIIAIRQWALAFQSMKAPATTLSASELILSIFLAYQSKDATSQGTTGLYIASSVLSFFIFPFTLYYMNPLNNHLLSRAKEQENFHYADLPEKNAGMQTAADHNRILAWGWYNWFRSAAYASIVGVNAIAVYKQL